MSKVMIALLLVVPLTAIAQDSQPDPPGIAVGEQAPEFELNDQLGRPIKLSTMLKKGPVAVVFHRSASW